MTRDYFSCPPPEEPMPTHDCPYPAGVGSGYTYRDIDSTAMSWILSESANLQGPPTGISGSGQIEQQCAGQSTLPQNCGDFSQPPGGSNCGEGPPSGTYPCPEFNQPPCNGGAPTEFYPSPQFNQPGGSGPSPSEYNPPGPTNQPPAESTYPNYPTDPNSPTSPASTPPEVSSQNPSNTGTSPEVPGSQVQISGQFPNYWSYRYPNGNEPSWNNTYSGSPYNSPLDNSSSIHYSQTYQVNPQSYSNGYYNQYTWKQYNSSGTAYGGSQPFQLPPAVLQYAKKYGE